MSVIIFHRSHSKPNSLPPSNQPSTADGLQNQNKQSTPSFQNELDNLFSTPKRASADGLSEFSYQVKEADKTVRISIEAKYQGEIPIKETIRVPLQPWSLFHIFLLPDTGKVGLVNMATFSSRSSVEYPQQNYIGKVLTTDTETLLYLRGRIPNIKGFKNVIVEEGQDSAAAFRRYSSKVKRFLEDINDRKAKLGTIDLFKQLGYLEAQVDVLTEIIVEAGLVRDKRLRGFLEASRQNAIQKSVSLEKLQERLKYKQHVRGVDSFY